jgi:hypothetical protein
VQALPTKDGYKFLKEASGSDVDKSLLVKKHLSSEELRDKFYSSVRGREIIERVEAPVGEGGDQVRGMAEKKYANSWSKSLKLVVRREVLLWWRDKYQIYAKLGQGMSPVEENDEVLISFRLCLALTISLSLSLSSALITSIIVGKLRLIFRTPTSSLLDLSSHFQLLSAL